MTIQEAIEILTQDDYGNCDCGNWCQAYDIAIRSLKAWAQIKEELESIAEGQVDDSKKKLIIEIPEDEYDLIMKSDRNCIADSVSKEAMMYAIKNGKPVKNFFL